MDAYVVELHDGGMRKLTNQLRLAQELLFQVFAETVDEGFEGHGAADDIVPRPFHAARGSGPDGFQGFLAAFLDRKITRLNSSHVERSYAVFRLKKKKQIQTCALFYLNEAILVIPIAYM